VWLRDFDCRDATATTPSGVILFNSYEGVVTTTRDPQGG
jgi:hypothetical protein